MSGQEETVETERSHARELAHGLVEEAWNLGAEPLVLTMQFEGALWQVQGKAAGSEG